MTALLSDRDSVKLADLLVRYFTDNAEAASDFTRPEQVTVRELLEDLAMSADLEHSRLIEEAIDRIDGLHSGEEIEL